MSHSTANPSQSKKTKRLGIVVIAALTLVSLQYAPKVSAAGTDLIDFRVLAPVAFAGSDITLPISGTFTGLNVDWGDGSTGTYNSGDTVSHNYFQGGYDVAVSQPALGQVDNFGDVLGWQGASMLTDVTDWNNIGGLRGAFVGTSIQTVPTFLPAGVTNLSYMFSNTSFDSDLSSWDTHAITNMDNMFSYSAFNSNITTWDVSQVTNMHAMFSRGNFNSALSGWQTQSVTDMSDMFSGAPFFNQDISAWNVNSVRDFSGMFENASRFNRPLASWDTSNAVNMAHMFMMAEGPSQFNQPLNNWNTSQVTNMSHMFDSAFRFNQTLNQWDVSSVADFSYMFSGATRFNGALDSWNTAVATDMTSMFSQTAFDQPISGWNISNVVSTSHMFDSDADFSQQLNTWDFSSVVDASYMFEGAGSFSSDISGWHTSSLSILTNMFDGASSFDVNLGSWNMSNATNVHGIFAGTALTAETYSAALIGWAAQSVNPNLVMDSARYYVDDAQTTNAISVLTGDGNHWIFSSDLPAEPITFDLGGGNGVAPTLSAMIPGSITPLPDGTGFSKIGFTFLGWADTPSGGSLLTASDTYTVPSAPVVFYAQWAPAAGGPAPAVQISYDLNGGAGITPPTVSSPAGSSLTLPASNQFARTGYVFAGWNDAPPGGITRSAGSAFTTPNTAIIFYAQWNAIVIQGPSTVQVSYGLNGGIGNTPPPANYTAGARFVLPGNDEFSRLGFDFAGWSDGQRTFSPGAEFIAGTHATSFVAVWVSHASSVKPIVTLELAGGISSKDTRQELESGALYSVPSTQDVAKHGYTLEGWNDGTSLYLPGALLKMGTTDVKLTAIWKFVKLPQKIPTVTLRSALYPSMAISLPLVTDVGLPIAYTIDAGFQNSCSVLSNNRIGLKSGGTCQITASQTGNEVYLPAETVKITFPILPVPSKVRKILFKFEGSRLVFNDQSKKALNNYAAYVNKLSADPALALRINIRSYFKADGTVTAISKQRKKALESYLVRAGIPISESGKNIDVHIYFVPGYHARYSWVSAPEVRVLPES